MTDDKKKIPTGQAVFENLKNKIISGEYAIGTNLPSERGLVGALGVSRGAVREALQRLAQSKLVTISHGGGTKVNDFKETAGLDLLSNLIKSGNAEVDLQVFRSLMEMRSALGVDAARFAAIRRTEEQKDQILKKFEEMKACKDEPALHKKVLEYWDIIIDASENIAYKLSMNTLKEQYEDFESYRGTFSTREYKFTYYQKLTQAIVNKHHVKAESAARAVVNRDAELVIEALDLDEHLPTFPIE